MKVWLIKNTNTNTCIPRIYLRKQDAVRIIKLVYDRTYEPFELNTDINFEEI